MKHDFIFRLAIALPMAAYYAFSCTYTGVYRIPYLIALLVFSLIALRDFYRLASRNKCERALVVPGFGFSIVFILIFWNESVKILPYFSDLPTWIRTLSLSVSMQTVLPVLVAFIFVTAITQLLGGETNGSLYSAGTTVFGVLYTVLPICHTALLLTLPDALFYGWLVSWCTFMGDTAAYIAGKAWGKHPLGIYVSPHKTLEGYAGGAVLAVLFAECFYFVAHRMFEVPKLSALTVAMGALGIFALTMIGDLVESLLKRDGGKKDSGSYLGDHGGLLDVIDSYLLTLPFSYYWLKWYL